MSTQSARGVAIAALVLLALASSCGMIADKDRIKIATLNGKPITRGDFDKVLRDMSPKERPLIRTKGDLLTAVQNYLDKCVRYENAEQLVADKKIFVRRDLAEAILRVREPELFVDIQNPEDYKMKQEDMKYLEEDRQIRIDEMLKELEAEQGVLYRIDEAIQNSTITITEDEYKTEFDLRSAELMHPERLEFTGVLIPGATEEARAASVKAAQQLRAGTPPDDVVKEFADLKAQIIQAELANDPTKTKFAPFWQQAAGAQPGGVIGPIPIQGWTEATQDAQGKVTERPYPNGMLVCLITGRTEPTPKTLEEAKPELQHGILYGKVMEQLRKENGVQIFEDKLSDPGMYYTQ